MEDLVKKWRGRRVFITGHTGFKGSWLTLWLTSLGATVRGYALEPESCPNMFSATNVGQLVEDIRGDIRDFVLLEDSMRNFAPEVVFHLAAQPLVRRSYSDPLGTFSTNVLGTANLLEAIRKISSVRAVLVVTTDKCYENREWVWPYRETDPLGGHDPYSSSKACAEIVCAAYRDSFFPVDQLKEHHVAVASARAGNVIGGGDWSEDRLVPDLIRGFQTARKVLIRHPTSIRPWQHVLEPLYGYILLADRLFTGQTAYASSFNFGPNDDEMWPVRRIADFVARLWGTEASWSTDLAPSVHEAQALRLDSSRARAELSWRPRLKIEDALRWTVDWYRAASQGADLLQETLAQIAKYGMTAAD